MSCISVYVVIVLVLVVLRNECQSKIVSGVISSTKDWTFLGRFCFLSQKGQLAFDFIYPKAYRTQFLLLYFDGPDQWPAVYPHEELTCDQKMKVLNYTKGQIIRLSEDFVWAGCSQYNLDGEAWYQCKQVRQFSSSRERWWYFVVAACGPYNRKRDAKGLYLRYNLTMTNALDTNDVFFYHFSADEFYVLQTDLGFLGLYLLLMAFSTYTAVLLRSRNFLHSTFKLYLASIILNMVAICFSISFYAKLAGTGREDKALMAIGTFLTWTGVLVWLLLLIIMGKGFTVTRGRISAVGTVKIAVFMTVYSVAYMAIYVYSEIYFDPGIVLYLYESPPGFGIIVLRIVGWIWFGYACLITVKHFPRKSPFYLPFFLFYTLWFLSMPALVLISSQGIPKYMRSKVINGLELSMTWLAHFVFLVLTRPSAANRNFPYHVRTTQIGVIDDQKQGADCVQYSSSGQYFVDNAGLGTGQAYHNAIDKQTTEVPQSSSQVDVFTVQGSRSAAAEPPPAGLGPIAGLFQASIAN